MDCALNVVACVNCKSGCDRTGLVYALRAAVAMVWETRPDERTEVCRPVMFASVGVVIVMYGNDRGAFTHKSTQRTRKLVHASASLSACPNRNTQTTPSLVACS
jgi:hypothetical protein